MKGQDKDSLGNYFMRMWLVSVGKLGLWNGHPCWDRDSRRPQWEGKKLLPSSTRKESHKDSRKSGMAPPLSGAWAYIRPSDKPPFSRCFLLWAVPWSLHAACPQITYK